MELKKRIPNSRLWQSFGISASKPIESTLWIWEALVQVKHMPLIRLETLVEFRINCLHLSFGTIFAEGWSNEELSESIKTFLECIVWYIKEIVGVSKGCECIFHSSIVLHEGRIFVLEWVFFGSHKKHMFQEMSCSIKRFRVKTDSNFDIQTSWSLVRLWITDQNNSQLVRERKILVFSLVKFRLLDFNLVGIWATTATRGILGAKSHIDLIMKCWMLQTESWHLREPASLCLHHNLWSWWCGELLVCSVIPEGGLRTKARNRHRSSSR